MDVDIKPEEEEVIWSDTFDAGYSCAENRYDTAKQRLICNRLEDTKSNDSEIKMKSTKVGAPLQTAVNVGGIGVVRVHTEQDSPSTSVGNLIKEEPCFYMSPSDIQIGKVCTLSRSVLVSNIKQANVMSFAEKVVKNCYPLCKEIGVEFDVRSKPLSKTKLDSQLLTNGVMYEVHKFAKNTKRSYTYTVYNILKYNFNVCFQNQKRCQDALRIASKLNRIAKTETCRK